jgi:hypothetical protein
MQAIEKKRLFDPLSLGCTWFVLGHTYAARPERTSRRVDDDEWSCSGVDEAAPLRAVPAGGLPHGVERERGVHVSRSIVICG